MFFRFLCYFLFVCFFFFFFQNSTQASVHVPWMPLLYLGIAPSMAWKKKGRKAKHFEGLVISMAKHNRSSEGLVISYQKTVGHDSKRKAAMFLNSYVFKYLSDFFQYISSYVFDFLFVCSIFDLFNLF